MRVLFCLLYRLSNIFLRSSFSRCLSSTHFMISIFSPRLFSSSVLNTHTHTHTHTHTPHSYTLSNLPRLLSFLLTSHLPHSFSPQRLIGEMNNTQLLRLNWWQRSQASVPINLLSFSCVQENGIFEMPSAETLHG